MTARPRMRPSSPLRMCHVWLLVLLSLPLFGVPQPCCSTSAQEDGDRVDNKTVRLLLRMRSFYLSFWPEARPLLGRSTSDRRRKRLRRTFRSKLATIERMYSHLRREETRSAPSSFRLLKRLYRRLMSGEAPPRSSTRWVHRNPRQRLRRAGAATSTLRSFFLVRLLRELRRHDRIPSRDLFDRVRETLSSLRSELLQLWARVSVGRETPWSERARIRQIASLKRRLHRLSDRLNRVLWLWRNRSSTLCPAERRRLKSGRSLKRTIARLRRRVQRRIHFGNRRYRRESTPPVEVLRVRVRKRFVAALERFRKQRRATRRRRISKRFDRAASSSPIHSSTTPSDSMSQSGARTLSPPETNMPTLRKVTAILLAPRRRHETTPWPDNLRHARRRVRRLDALLQRFGRRISANQPGTRQSISTLKQDVQTWIDREHEK